MAHPQLPQQEQRSGVYVCGLWQGNGFGAIGGVGLGQRQRTCPLPLEQEGWRKAGMASLLSLKREVRILLRWRRGRGEG